MSRQRGPDGQWLKTDGDVPADGSGSPTVIVILSEVDDPAGLEWGTRTVSAGFAIDLDAGHLVDAMTRAHLDHTRTAIMAGKRRDKEARSRIMSPDTQDQLRDEAVLCRTLELAIERGDDLRSGECITIDDIPAADLVSIDAIGCVVGDMFTGFKQSIEAPSKTGIAIALHLGGWRVGMSVEEAHAIIARSGILLYEVTPIARATGGGE